MGCYIDLTLKMLNQTVETRMHTPHKQNKKQGGGGTKNYIMIARISVLMIKMWH